MWPSLKNNLHLKTICVLSFFHLFDLHNITLGSYKCNKNKHHQNCCFRETETNEKHIFDHRLKSYNQHYDDQVVASTMKVAAPV